MGNAHEVAVQDDQIYENPLKSVAWRRSPSPLTGTAYADKMADTREEWGDTVQGTVA